MTRYAIEHSRDRDKGPPDTYGSSRRAPDPARRSCPCVEIELLQSQWVTLVPGSRRDAAPTMDMWVPYSSQPHSVSALHAPVYWPSDASCPHSSAASSDSPEGGSRLQDALRCFCLPLLADVPVARKSTRERRQQSRPIERRILVKRVRRVETRSQI